MLSLTNFGTQLIKCYGWNFSIIKSLLCICSSDKLCKQRLINESINFYDSKFDINRRIIC